MFTVAPDFGERPAFRNLLDNLSIEDENQRMETLLRESTGDIVAVLQTIAGVVKLEDLRQLQISAINELLSESSSLDDCDLPETITAGRKQRYLIGDQLGKGGIGEVFKTFDRKLGRQIAFKRLQAKERTRGSKARLHGEAKLTARLDHPNIIPIYDLGTRAPLVGLPAPAEDE